MNNINDINIIIRMKNIRYAKALARGLCNESTNLNVFFADSDGKVEEMMDNGILITDYDMPRSPKILFLSDDIKTNDKHISVSKLSPAKDIFTEVVELAYINYGIKCKNMQIEKTKIVSLNTCQGGSGVTTIAIGMARVLSLKSNKVIYVNFGPIDDYEKYVNAQFDYLNNKRQYIMQKEMGIGQGIERFITKDEWGVYYFKPQMKVNSFFSELDQRKILEYLIDETLFSHIIADYGKNAKSNKDNDEILITVYKKRHHRVLSKKLVESDLEIINFADAFDMDVSKSYINCDKDSFIDNDEKLEISMAGYFINEIEKIIKSNEILFL